jgi:hypothetical protein
MSKSIKRTVVVLLLAPLFPSCETAHDAAVATFRVIDAPAAYVRRRIDEEPQATPTTTSESQVYSDTAANPPSASYPVQSPPPTQTQRRVVTDEPSPPAEGETQPTATPHVAKNENVSRPQATNSSVAHTTSSQNTDIPYGKPVPGKPGYVFSPFDKNGGYVDVTGYSPGQKVKDPYTGRIFLVP